MGKVQNADTTGALAYGTTVSLSCSNARMHLLCPLFNLACSIGLVAVACVEAP